jgi:hypothetical protein
VVEVLEAMDLAFPTLTRAARKQLAAARTALDGHARQRKESGGK